MIDRGAATAPVQAPDQGAGRARTERTTATKGSRATTRYRGAVGKKAVMAVTGALMIGFLVLHMIGNLKVFAGRDSFNDYAAWLRTVGEPMLPPSGFLWIQRIGLLVILALHITAAVQLTVQAKRARPVKYHVKRRVQQSYASRTMRWGGVIIAAFVVYHILDLTVGVANPAGTAADPYTRLVADFQRWYLVVAYAVPLLLLGLHLRHGVWSAAQSLGRGGTARERPIKLFATGFAVVLVAGFLLAPVGVLVGVVK
ncbi:succinate dehydrogenase cytochrome b subunit [Rhizohabitans arisaemae]|uniref:succinate dehydrogenase cytochrome b subunit n=1 Tax=Rhizohabitans arisaemae TaxID=2720610 RepID=UPI0024B1ADC0|nr:succinate dehydrogenase cytochrome b subunit [Rhizohabitans arisaemae]